MATHLKPAAVCQATERYLLQEEHCTLSHCLQVSSMFPPTFSQLMTEPPYFTKTRELSTTKSTNRPISIAIPMVLPPVILDEMSLCLPQTALPLGLWISSPLTFSQISLSYVFLPSPTPSLSISLVWSMLWLSLLEIPSSMHSDLHLSSHFTIFLCNNNSGLNG